MYKLITPYASDFGKPNITIKHFPDTESYILIPKIETLKNKKVTIYHRLYPEPEKRLFELMLVLSRVKEKTKNVELFAPYLPYARQDRENKLGEAVSADVLCEILKNYGVKKLITYDCHFLLKPGNFARNGLKIENKSAGEQLLVCAKKYFGEECFTVISPDEGASHFTLNAQGYALRKTRKKNKANGVKNGTHADVHKIEGDAKVEGENILILDDMISTGGTLIQAMKHLREKGAKRIICGATHGIFAGENIANKIMAGFCDYLFVTNSIRDNKNKFIEVLKLE